ncbi:alpha/beta hydrolase [Actinotalea sp. K2]|uniref:alpha/beta hydrolase n=1 Tax=Actinotalea sp. K2 TaxID=2939438 RepID=UPI002017CA01|nr:alpha/beta fold hydrolase [Actinotalea sp. K2]MCL3860940.1 alpha/beta fold hydrolase [Actinotalea sp. K2]
MPEVVIATPRGVHLSGTFTPPTLEPPSGLAVVFAHGFLGERSSRGRNDRLAAAYREAGHATLTFDFSGCGSSDDDVVTVAHEVEDLHAAIGHVVQAGFGLVVLHGHSLGSLVCLRTHSAHVVAMVLTGAITGPINHPWREVLGPDHWTELLRTGRTRVLDDGPTAREHNVISTQTLADFSDVGQAALLGAVTCPVLLVHGGALVDGEENELLTRSRVGLPLLPEGSRLEIVRGADHALMQDTENVAQWALDWLARTLAL